MKIILKNPLARKLAVFAIVFAAALSCMSGALLANRYGEAEARATMAPVPARTPRVVNHYAVSIRAVESPIVIPGSPDATITDTRAEPTDLPIRILPAETPLDGNSSKPAASSAPSAAKKPAGFVYSAEIPLSEELHRYTYERCEANELDYELVLALMWRESRFQTQAVHINRNGTQDSGIMQINDVNRGWLAEKHGITDLMDPKQNIAAGTTMLGGFTNKYGEHNALLAYQYGEAGMRRKLAQGVTTNKQIQLLYSKRADFVALLS
jgi:soluble lytic murein transglycosylase-like protein